ncbi:MAG: putative 4-hydroxybenzoate polyprenyltransferase [Spirochaetia bacterium]|nr:putative 4-hydroxybenzoate polyprenyltransferase [Spirochaetia bacterium]
MLKTSLLFGRMIKFSHTIFALPFALVAVLFIWQAKEIHLNVYKVIYIILAFTGMRSFAMAVNRIADAKIDKQNPRTANREIPAGKLTTNQVIIFACLSLITIWIFAYLLHPLAFYLSFPAILIVGGYSYSKRYTWLCHIWLGVAIGMAPLGVYIALSQKLPIEAWILFITLSSYIAGFDILYSLQDAQFDRKMKLYSIPASLGENKALFISALLHLITITGIFYLYIHLNLKNIYLAGSIIIALLISAEHLIVGWGKNLKKEKIPLAFFHFNSAVSISFFLFTLLDILIVL